MDRRIDGQTISLSRAKITHMVVFIENAHKQRNVVSSTWAIMILVKSMKWKMKSNNKTNTPMMRKCQGLFIS